MKINNVNFRKSIELCANSGVQEKQTTTDKQCDKIQVGVENRS